MSEIERPSRPRPRANPDSEGFWAALRNGELAIQRCRDCDRWQFPALERCRSCGGELGYQALCGRGEVHSFIVQHHAVAPGFDADRPYPIALVTPDEAPDCRIPGRIVGSAPEKIAVGARVIADVMPGSVEAEGDVVFRLV